MERESPDFLPMLLSLTTGTGRSSTTNLRGDNAKVTLGALDEVGYPFAVAREWPVVIYVPPSTRFLRMVKSQTDTNVTPSV